MTQAATAIPDMPRPCGCGGGGDGCRSLSGSVLELSLVGLELARGLISGESYDPRQVALKALRAGVAFTEGMGAGVPWLDRWRWQELANKLTAYRLFVSADRLLAGAADLPEILRSLSRFDSYSRVWITEGLGWYWADRATGGNAGAGLFDRNVPTHSLVPLHTGAGLALAQRALASHETGGLRTALREFRERCERLSVQGYHGAMFEALGLVAINLYPSLAGEIEAELTPADEVEFFWHGAGRGSYFSPVNFVPLGAARRRTVAPFRQLPASGAGRDNAWAGFAWATTLVNIRHPEVLDCCLGDLGSMAESADGFANGIASALMIWREVSPGDPYLRRWSRFQAARDAERWYGPMQARGSWGSLFRVQSFQD